MTHLTLFFMLLIGHALADFALQSTDMAKGKNRHNKVIPPKGQKYVACWPYWMSAHSLIHGGAVWFCTGMVGLGLAETVVHFLTDMVKCEGHTNPHGDQLIHLACKVLWVIIVLGI